MAISKKLLNPGERLILSTRQHPKALFVPILALVVLLAIGVVAEANLDDDGFPQVLGYIVWVLVALGILWFTVRPFLVWLTTVHAFTDRRLITRNGIITRRGHDIPLARVSDISIEINLIDRPFGCGSLLIADASTHGMVRLNDIPHVESAQRQLNELLHDLHRGPACAATKVSEGDPELTFLGEEPQLTATEVADRAGIPLAQARRLWRTLGFPERGDARAYTEGDVTALRLMVDLLGEGIIDFDVALNVARGVGLSMARLADWEVGELVHHVDEAFVEQGGADDGDPTAWVMKRFGTRFEDLLVYAWRRHLAAAVDRMQSVRAIDADPHTTDLSVGFADIVGFTALSNEVSRERIGELVEVFESRCGDVIAREQGRLIKSMGDAVLFVNDDPMAAFATAEGIINVIGRDPRMPDVRVGLASGGVVLRLGDVFGPPVNLAARLTQVARRNRIIVDHATADLLPADQIESRPLPPRPVRGFGVVEPVAVRRA